LYLPGRRRVNCLSKPPETIADGGVRGAFSDFAAPMFVLRLGAG